jgi:hypothetical protein
MLLPRQARDKHREKHSKQRRVFLRPPASAAGVVGGDGAGALGGLDEFGLAVATAPAEGSTRFICAFVDNTKGVSGDIEAQIWIVRSNYNASGSGTFEASCVGLSEGELVLDLAFYSNGKLAVLLGDEVGQLNEGAVGGGTPDEEEGVRSSLIMLSYDELDFEPLPPVGIPGVPPPWLTGFSAMNATALDDAVEKRRSVSTMTRRSQGGRGGRCIAMGGTRGLGCVLTVRKTHFGCAVS